MKVIKLSFENSNGKYRMFITDAQLLSILENYNFTNAFIDAKNGDVHQPDRDILAALKIEPPKNNT